jgi:hypothetical protein
VCWEILERGKLPYDTLTNEEVISHVLEGFRPDRPSECTDEVWNIITECWAADPESRPTFQEVIPDVV